MRRSIAWAVVCLACVAVAGALWWIVPRQGLNPEGSQGAENARDASRSRKQARKAAQAEQNPRLTEESSAELCGESPETEASVSDRVLFLPPQVFHTGRQVSNLQVGDLNGDGKLDLVIASRQADLVTILINETEPGAAKVSFAPQHDLVSSLSTKVQTRLGQPRFAPRHVSLADINQDGRLDLAITNGNSDTLAIYVNQTAAGSPNLEFLPLYEIDLDHNCTAIADLDGDGKLDLVAVHRETDPSTIYAFRNRTRPFASRPDLVRERTLFTDGPQSFYVALHDLNGDGRPDLVATTQKAGTVSLFTNTTVGGKLSFGERYTLPSGRGAFPLVVHDITGDGKPDLVVSNSDESTVSLFVNQTRSGDPKLSFASLAPLRVRGHARGIAIGDLDDDGWPDLAVANGRPGRGTVYFGSGHSQTPFEQSFTLSSGGACAVQVLIADMNADGLLDLVIGNDDPSGRSICIYLQSPP